MINLIVVAHPDDEVLGFGGTGAFYVSSGDSVQPIILCGSVEARLQRPSDEQLLQNIFEANKTLGFNKPILGKFPNLGMNLVPHLEIVKFIEQQIIKYQPDRIFTHHPSDLNDDHKKISEACMTAARLSQRKKNIKPINALYFMEILSSTDWAFPSSNGSKFIPNVFVDINETFNKKLEALFCYKDVMREPPHPRSKEVLRGHASYRGGQSGFLLAEAFQQVYRNNL
jgi:LmbE family N-acetylglucosaminyl deacetylase